MLVDDDKVNLMADSHTETDPGEARAPVSGQLGLLLVQPSLPPWKVEVDLVAPQLGIVTKCRLINRKKREMFAEECCLYTTQERTLVTVFD